MFWRTSYRVVPHLCYRVCVPAAMRRAFPVSPIMCELVWECATSERVCVSAGFYGDGSHHCRASWQVQSALLSNWAGLQRPGCTCLGTKVAPGRVPVSTLGLPRPFQAGLQGFLWRVLAALSFAWVWWSWPLCWAPRSEHSCTSLVWLRCPYWLGDSLLVHGFLPLDDCSPMHGDWGAFPWNVHGLVSKSLAPCLI